MLRAEGLGWPHGEASASVGVQEPAKDGRAIEVGPAQPVDRAPSGDEGGGAGVAHHSIVGDGQIARGFRLLLWMLLRELFRGVHGRRARKASTTSRSAQPEVWGQTAL